MRNILVIVFCSSLLTAVAQQESADSILHSLVVEKVIVGAAGAYLKNDQVLWMGESGKIDPDSNAPFLVSTPTRLASIAKPMTALAVMQLVEKGQIDLDAPIQQYIPEYPRQKNVQITSRQLLSHTSGIPGYKNSKEAETTQAYANLTEAMKLFQHRALLFEPGTQYSYTSYGYTVLGVLIERVSGLSFEAYIRKYIWEPSGMDRTGVVRFRQPTPGQSGLYHLNDKGRLREGIENNLSNRIPGGGIYSTVEDMLKFGKAVLDHQLVSETTLDLMRQHHSLEKEANAYGFGWFLYNPKPNEGAIIGHSGEQTGAANQFFIIPQTKEVIIILTNTSGALRHIGPACFEIRAALNP